MRYNTHCAQNITGQAEEGEKNRHAVSSRKKSTKHIGTEMQIERNTGRTNENKERPWRRIFTTRISK